MVGSDLYGGKGLMFLSVRHKPMRELAYRAEVIDLNSGKLIHNVVWANDTTGRYRRHLKDESGEYIVDGDQVKSKVFNGNIKIRIKSNE